MDGSARTTPASSVSWKTVTQHTQGKEPKKGDLITHFTSQHPPEKPTTPIRLKGPSFAAFKESDSPTVSTLPPSSRETAKTRRFSFAWFKNLAASVMRKSQGVQIQTPKIPTSIRRAAKNFIEKEPPKNAEDKKLIREYFDVNLSGSPFIKELVDKDKTEEAKKLLGAVNLRAGGNSYKGLVNEFNSTISRIIEKGEISQSDKKFIKFCIGLPQITNFGALRKLKRSNEKLYDSLLSSLQDTDSKKIKDYMTKADKTEKAALILLAKFKRRTLTAEDIENNKVSQPLGDRLENAKIILNDYFKEPDSDFEAGINKLVELAKEGKVELLLEILKNKSISGVSSHLLEKLGPDKGLLLIKLAFLKELQGKTDPNTFFRSNSVATNLMSAYLGQMMNNALGDKLREFLKKNLPTDFPETLSGDALKESDQEKYILEVTKFMNKLVKFFEENENKIPPQIKKLNAFLRDEFNEKIPEKGQNYCTSNFYLRFICPLLTGANTIGLESTEQQRAGVGIGKILQSLANLSVSKSKGQSKEGKLQFALDHFNTPAHSEKINQVMKYVQS